jgi:phenylalanine-4-hydroxylase
MQTTAAFWRGCGTLAMEHADDDEALELIGRFYWFTIEFGLIRENGELKIYGAGIMSSSEETRHCMGPDCVRRDYDIRCNHSHPLSQ